mgnify:CR=1 FL=1
MYLNMNVNMCLPWVFGLSKSPLILIDIWICQSKQPVMFECTYSMILIKVDLGNLGWALRRTEKIRRVCVIGFNQPPHYHVRQGPRIGMDYMKPMEAQNIENCSFNTSYLHAHADLTNILQDLAFTYLITNAYKICMVSSSAHRLISIAKYQHKEIW